MKRLDETKGDSTPEQTLHHYVFAHVALRQVCFANPVGFFAVMASPHRERFLMELWRQICRNCDQQGEAPFALQDVRIQTLTIRGHPAVLVQMPTPHQAPEAHMIGMILKVPDSALQPPRREVQVRYFTLEKAAPGSAEHPTFLCGWEGETHVNYGVSPEPTLPAFMQAISERI